MSKFYLTDPNIINAALTDKEFRIYHYCCSNYNVQKRSAYIRIVDIAGLFQLSKKEVEELLIKLSQIRGFEIGVDFAEAYHLHRLFF